MKDNDKALILYNTSKDISNDVEDVLWMCLDNYELPASISSGLELSKELLAVYNSHRAALMAMVDSWVDVVLNDVNNGSAETQEINIVDEQSPMPTSLG